MFYSENEQNKDRGVTAFRNKQSSQSKPNRHNSIGDVWDAEAVYESIFDDIIHAR